MIMLLLSMEGCVKSTLPQSGFVQQAIQAGQITVGYLLIWTPRIVQEKTFKILDACLYSGS